MSEEEFNEALEEFTRIADEIDQEMQEEENKVYVCASCGHEVDDQSELFEIGGEWYCESCVSYCDQCESYVLEGDINSVDRHNGDTTYLCDNCLDDMTFTCDHCGTTTHNDDRLGDDNTNICQYCYENYYGYCDECGDLIHQDSLYYHEGSGYYLCEYCHDQYPSDDQDEDNYIHSYSYKPSAKFHKMLNEHLKYEGYGLEIETDKNRGDRYEYLEQLYDLSHNEDIFYLKEDGSLSSRGVEIVTHVGTKDFWLNSVVFDDIRRIALANDYRSHNIDSCGLHIHASKSLFGDNDQEIELAITKMIILLDRFWDRVVKVSRRSKESINNWSAKYDLDKPSFNEVYGKANHYRVICLTGRTVELRMFKGTLKVSSIKSAIEFYDGLIRFSKVMSLETVLKCSFDQFREYLEKDTTYLSEYLNTRIGSYDKPYDSLCFDHALDIDDISYEHEIISDQVVNNHVIIEA